MLKVVPDESALIHSEGDYATLLVSDLHLGLEKEMASKGFRLPPYSQKMLDRINSIAEKNRLNRIIVVGDVKHSIGKVQDIDWGILPCSLAPSSTSSRRSRWSPGTTTG